MFRSIGAMLVGFNRIMDSWTRLNHHMDSRCLFDFAAYQTLLTQCQTTKPILDRQRNQTRKLSSLLMLLLAEVEKMTMVNLPWSPSHSENFFPHYKHRIKTETTQQVSHFYEKHTHTPFLSWKDFPLDARINLRWKKNRPPAVKNGLRSAIHN